MVRSRRAPAARRPRRLAALAALAPPPARAAQEAPPPPPAEETEPAAAAPSLDDYLGPAEGAADEAVAAEAAQLPFTLRARPLGGLPAGMAALLLGGGASGPVVVAAQAVPLGPPVPGGGATAVVALTVEIDGPSLLGDAAPESPEVQVFAYALTAEGAVRGYLAQSFRLDLEKLGEAVYVGGVKFLGHLELPPGSYQLRLLVHESASQRYALRELHLEVPDRPALLAPLVDEPPAHWVLVAEAPHDAAGEVPFADLFRRVGVGLPSALPVLQEDAAEISVPLYGAAGVALPARLDARLEPSGDRPPLHVAAPVLERQAAVAPGLDRLRVRLPLADVPVGSYRLTLVAAGVGGSDLTTPELRLAVTHQRNQEVVWTDIQRRLSGAAPPPPVELDTGRRRAGRERLRRAVEAAYTQVLERRAAGDRSGALAALESIERQTLERAAEDAYQTLEEAEGAVATGLAAVDPEALLPVATFHAAAYRRYRDQRAYGLATRARNRAGAVAQLYATTRADPAAARLASALLASLGDELQRAQVRATAREVLGRAVELDPENGFALLNLAVGLEKQADYAPAVQVLQRLVANDPKSPEGRLRLAVNLERIGRTDEARTLLDRLVRESNPDWILTLAYETLGMELLRADRPADAVDLLRQAVARLPGQARLALELAYAEERAGHARAAAAAMAGFGTAPAGAVSPRHQYNLWPEGGREELVRRLDEATLVRQPSLAAALARLPEGRR